MKSICVNFFDNFFNFLSRSRFFLCFRFCAASRIFISCAPLCFALRFWRANVVCGSSAGRRPDCCGAVIFSVRRPAGRRLGRRSPASAATRPPLRLLFRGRFLISYPRISSVAGEQFRALRPSSAAFYPRCGGLAALCSSVFVGSLTCSWLALYPVLGGLGEYVVFFVVT